RLRQPERPDQPSRILGASSEMERPLVEAPHLIFPKLLGQLDESEEGHYDHKGDEQHHGFLTEEPAVWEPERLQIGAGECSRRKQAHHPGALSPRRAWLDFERA